MKKCNLAQANIARALAPMDSDVMKGFVDRLDEINAIADKAPGFVWRMQTEEGHAITIQTFDDPLQFINMSVWDDLESLKNYVYKSLHVDLIRDRSAWFSKLAKAHQVLWWVPEEHIPTVEEAKERLAHLQEHGPSAQAFTFAKPFAADAEQ